MTDDIENQSSRVYVHWPYEDHVILNSRKHGDALRTIHTAFEETIRKHSESSSEAASVELEGQFDKLFIKLKRVYKKTGLKGDMLEYRLEQCIKALEKAINHAQDEVPEAPTLAPEKDSHVEKLHLRSYPPKFSRN